MKKQTFIAKIRDNNGNMIGFERFNCRRPETVKKHMQQLFKSELYRICNETAKSIEIWETPDGYKTEKLIMKYEI